MELRFERRHLDAVVRDLDRHETVEDALRRELGSDLFERCVRARERHRFGRVQRGDRDVRPPTESEVASIVPWPATVCCSRLR